MQSAGSNNKGKLAKRIYKGCRCGNKYCFKKKIGKLRLGPNISLEPINDASVESNTGQLSGIKQPTATFVRKAV